MGAPLSFAPLLAHQRCCPLPSSVNRDQRALEAERERVRKEARETVLRERQQILQRLGAQAPSDGCAESTVEEKAAPPPVVPKPAPVRKSAAPSPAASPAPAAAAAAAVVARPKVKAVAVVAKPAVPSRSLAQTRKPAVKHKVSISSDGDDGSSESSADANDSSASDPESSECDESSPPKRKPVAKKAAAAAKKAVAKKPKLEVCSLTHTTDRHLNPIDLCNTTCPLFDPMLCV